MDTTKNIDFKFHYECVNCGSEYSASGVKYLCPKCSQTNTTDKPPKGVLKTIFNYKNLLEKGVDYSVLKKDDFLDLLPIQRSESLPNLKIGNTPLVNIDRIDRSKLPFQLLLKDDSQNPTYSFKDRASALVSAFAKENGFDTIIAASTGNAGSSLAGICASQRQKAVVVVPQSAPLGKLTQILMYGAKIIPIEGTYDDAFDLSIKATEEFAWYNRNTAFNPLTIEGKKTVAFELYEQLNYTVPDRIFVPVGDGVILAGVYKGFEDLFKLGLIDHIPTLVAVQSSKSNNLIRNIGNANFSVEESCTIADSISVDIPRNFYMAKKYLLKYNGETISVSDHQIIESSGILSRNTGLFAEPAAAAAYAGFLSYLNAGKIAEGSKNIVLLTGSGLKDLQSVQKSISLPEAIPPNIENLKKLLS